MSDPSTPKKPRGFAAMTPEQRKKIAAMGGRTAHRLGRAHEWDSVAASAAGRVGGVAAHEKGTAHEWDSAEAAAAGEKGGHTAQENNRKRTKKQSE